MSGEIEVPEGPNWLKELEAKREKRVKARLGHEAGAGAPCLKCGDKCPGLDLHFWRKSCKICKCPKEEHEVQDDDIYGWAQFQLLGSKPNKIRRKILLPGKNDESDLEWVPKGHNETIDKYLKTLPPEQLPVKGSQAAQDRKQLLQKQIPIHDIDPSLCHELTEDELKKMNEYITHVKQASAGIGQIVSLSSIIKGKLHMLNPAEAAIIASRYAKGVPISEIVTLQGQNKTNALGQGLQNLTLKNKNLPQYVPNVLNQTEDVTNPLVSTKIHDKEYGLYSNDANRHLPNAHFSSGLEPKQQFKNAPNIPNQFPFDPSIDEKYLQNPNFDPKNRPSNFIGPNVPYNPNLHRDTLSLGKSPLEYNSNSAFVPYQKISTSAKPGDAYSESNSLPNPHYAQHMGQHRNYNPDQHSFNINNYGNTDMNEQIYENVRDLKKSPANLPNYAPGKFNTFADVQSPTKIPKNVKDLAFSTYEPGQINPNELNDHENGFKVGKYRQPGSYSDNKANVPKNSNGFRPIEAGYHSSLTQSNKSGQHFEPINPNVTRGTSSTGSATGDLNSYNAQFDPLSTNVYNANSYPLNSSSSKPGEMSLVDQKYGYQPQGLTAKDLASHDAQYESLNTNNYNVNSYPLNSTSLKSGDLRGVHPSSGMDQKHGYIGSQMPNSESLAGVRSGNLGGFKADNANQNYGHPEHTKDLRSGDLAAHNHNLANQAYSSDPNNYSYGNNLERGNEIYPLSNKFGASPVKSAKKLSELHPNNDLKIHEDFLNPNQVNIGLIQDINYPDIKTATHETGDFYEEYSPDSIKEILNNVILPDCHYCKKPFEENEFAVTIDRANVLFHAGCFKCAGCNQILADNVYFYNKETDNVYCLRDYAKIRGFPRCKACDELIFTKEYCLAENSTFHLKHFCCTECDMPLAGQDYTLEDEMPYCLPCFEQNKASKCNTCGKVIKPEEVGCNLKGVHFHAVDACFACKVCKTPLMGKKMLLRNDQLYCSHECFGTNQ